MKCAPARHKYRTFGKVLFCERCADVQPLLLAEEYDDVPAHGAERAALGVPPSPPEPEAAPPSVDELEATANLLRQAVGFTAQPTPQRGVQMDLGVRTPMDEDELLRMSNEYGSPRVPVHEGFETAAGDDQLLDPGL